MLISITTSPVTDEQLERVESFLAGFLPRLRQQSGVVEILHFARPKDASTTTIVVWENEEALHAYRESELLKEALALEQALGLVTTREAFPLLQRLA
jgi:heme-degrading monooxygenase HmoA